MQRSPRNPGTIVKIVALAALVVGGVTAAVVLGGNGGSVNPAPLTPHASTATPAATTSSTATTSTTTTTRPTNITTTTVVGQKTFTDFAGVRPATVKTGTSYICQTYPDLLTSAARAALYHAYGTTVFTVGDSGCVFDPTTDSWVLFFSSPDVTHAPGGDVVLVDRCSPDDSACVSSDTPHPLSAFTVYPAPDPYANGLAAVFWSQRTTGHTIGVADGKCGGVAFVPSTGTWYPHSDAPDLKATPPVALPDPVYVTPASYPASAAASSVPPIAPPSAIPSTCTFRTATVTGPDADATAATD